MPRNEVSKLLARQSVLAELQARFKEAASALQQGRLAHAERIFADILRQHPNLFDALQGLGIVAAQTGQPERAVELFRKAIKQNAKVANVHRNLGMALKELKRSKEALLSFDKAIALDPGYAECYNSRGLALQDLKRPAEALVAYERAIELKSYFPEAHYNRGLALQDLKRPAEALVAYDRAIELRPIFPEANYNRGVVLEHLMRPAEALAAYDTAIALKPDLAEAHSSRGNILQEQRRLQEALVSHDRAIALRPDFPEGHNNRGNALMYLERPEEALSSFETAIELKRDFVEAHNNRGLILQDLGRHEEALVAFDKAIALQPDYFEAVFNKSHLLLLTGQYEEGWRLHEARKKIRNPMAVGSYAQPLWRGEENIRNKRLFIWWEQGFGDTIQFCRYGKLAEARGAKVTMLVQEPLRQLLTQISPTIEIVRDAPIEFDYHCPLMSLPLALGTTLATIPAEPQYLKSDETLRRKWEARLPPKTKPRIGVVWSGSQVHGVIHDRSMPLDTFLRMLNSNAHWICLQYEIMGDDVAALQKDGRMTFFSGDDIKDFSDNAALLDLMDLVITIDTYTAHLAGAMGKPVWILLPYNANWRFLLNRYDSPWYPSARLFRQHEMGNWSGLIDDVKSELRAIVG